jgi:hypothetical protein
LALEPHFVDDFEPSIPLTANQREVPLLFATEIEYPEFFPPFIDSTKTVLPRAKGGQERKWLSGQCLVRAADVISRHEYIPETA